MLAAVFIGCEECNRNEVMGEKKHKGFEFTYLGDRILVIDRGKSISVADWPRKSGNRSRGQNDVSVTRHCRFALLVCLFSPRDWSLEMCM